MPSGGWLDVHLDCDRHPQTGYRRAVNAILFLDDWLPEWGGQLELWAADRSRCDVAITPGPNRLVIFRCDDVSYHGIPRPISCPPERWRRSLAVYWWEPSVGPAIRPRAEFVSVAGETSDPAKDAWRRKRAGR